MKNLLCSLEGMSLKTHSASRFLVLSLSFKFSTVVKCSINYLIIQALDNSKPLLSFRKLNLINHKSFRILLLGISQRYSFLFWYCAILDL